MNELACSEIEVFLPRHLKMMSEQQQTASFNYFTLAKRSS